MPTDLRKELAAILAGTRRVSRAWPGLRVTYAWRPPFEGEAVTQPNRLEVIFSAHSGVELRHDGRAHRVTAPAGAAYVVGAEPTVLRRVADYSDTLEIYPDLALMRAEAEDAGIAGFELQPTLGTERAVEFRRDPAILGVAHRLRCAVMGRAPLADIEASSLAHLLARRVLVRQHHLPPARAARLDPRRLARVAEAVEARLAGTVSLSEMAEEAGLSPFHFARSFKAATGLAPHQYVLARRIELAKRRLLGSRLPVEAIAWEAGFENLSHFRRQFAAQVGVLPGALRRATTGA
jgi:AraC family transcriptional regulator